MTSTLQPVEDWYDDPATSALTGVGALPLTVPFELPSRQTATETVSSGESFDRLDQSRVPSVTGGLPIDVNVANLLAGDYGLTTKPAVAGQIAPAFDLIAGVINNIFSGWSGSNPDESTPLQANYTIRAIKDAVLNGYIVSTFTSSAEFTVTDQMTELTVICTGGGANGGAGYGNGGGAGGKGGGYQAFPLDIPTILGTSTSVTVPVTVGAAGALSSFGTWAESAPGLGGIAGPMGWTPTASAPGNGGNGGNGGQGSPGQRGADGISTAVAAGGTGGAAPAINRNGERGEDGQSTDPAALTKCCGAGGGGGGGGGSDSGLVAYAGGAGGNGGYPGGGGGGGGGKGGGVGTGSPGGGGYGAPGIVFIFRKEAA